MLLKCLGLAAFIATAASIPLPLDDGLAAGDIADGAYSGLLRRATTPPIDPSGESNPLNSPIDKSKIPEFKVPQGVRAEGEIKPPKELQPEFLAFNDRSERIKALELWEGFVRDCFASKNAEVSRQLLLLSFPLSTAPILCREA